MAIKIHYHSDCDFFAGCENMLVNFFLDKQLNSYADLSFSYRDSQKYRKGFKARVNKKVDEFPLPLICSDSIFECVKPAYFKKILKIIAYIFLFRLWILLWNCVVMWSFFGKLEGIDLLHVNNGGYPGARSCMAAVFAARLRGVKKVVYVVNNVAVDYWSLNRVLDFPLDSLLVKCVDCFVTGSLFAGRSLSNVLRLKDSKLKCIHNGIILRPITEIKSQVAYRLKIPRKRIILTAIALLEERKGHIYLLQAMSLLKQQGVEMPTLLIEGNGIELRRLQNYVQAARLEQDVLFIGVEKNVFNLLSAADVVILPSISHEDFPNVVIEAMGLAKVVIASELAGTPEQIDDMESGVLVTPKCPEALANAIIKVVADEECRLRLARNANVKFNKKFTASVSVEKYISLYHDLLKGCK